MGTLNKLQKRRLIALWRKWIRANDKLVREGQRKKKAHISYMGFQAGICAHQYQKLLCDMKLITWDEIRNQVRKDFKKGGTHGRPSISP